MSMPGGQTALEKGIEAFVEEYAHKQYRRSFPDDGKVIHDPLWGTIRMAPWEIALLDLPLFQRLRQISQTSLVSFVFPGCRHTRFEHTLGVIHQVQKLTDAVNQQDSDDTRTFGYDRISELRLAALFHDCGHACFSHISENVYRDMPDMAAAIADGGPFAHCNPHEVMSALVLKSRPIREYLDELGKHYKKTFRVDTMAEWIVGRCDPGLEYEQQVLNGPFDADKLDYIFRDAHFSGLPVGLDLERLWSSCRVGSIELKESKKKQKILTLHKACVSPLEQILLSKMTLFAGVYQHPKVRASECMFHAAIQMILDRKQIVCGRVLANASDFLWMTDNHFFALADTLKGDDELHKIIHDILYRRHLVRAITISQDTIADSTSPEQKAAFSQLLALKQLDCHSERREIAKMIWEKADKPCAAHQIWLDLPTNPSKGGADSTFIDRGDGTYSSLAELFPIHYWLEMFTNHKWRGHVFCPPDCQQKVSDAAITVMREKYGLTFNTLAKALCKLT